MKVDMKIVAALIDVLTNPLTDYKQIVFKIAQTNPEALMNVITPPDEHEKHILDLVGQYSGNVTKIEVIKNFRSRFSWGLRETKEFVEKTAEKYNLAFMPYL